MSAPNYNLPFITHDRALASALIVKEFRLQSCSHANSEKVYFTFHGSKKLLESVELYWEDKLFLNARALLNTYKECLPQSPDQTR
jgi:hypothetical protein